MVRAPGGGHVPFWTSNCSAKAIPTGTVAVVRVVRFSATENSFHEKTKASTAGGDQPGHDERQHHPPERLRPPGAVDARGLLELGRDVADEVIISQTVSGRLIATWVRTSAVRVL